MTANNGVYEVTKALSMVEFLKGHGFTTETLGLLKHDNLIKLANEYGWNE